MTIHKLKFLGVFLLGFILGMDLESMSTRLNELEANMKDAVEEEDLLKADRVNREIVQLVRKIDLEKSCISWENKELRRVLETSQSRPDDLQKTNYQLEQENHNLQIEMTKLTKEFEALEAQFDATCGIGDSEKRIDVLQKQSPSSSISEIIGNISTLAQMELCKARNSIEKIKNEELLSGSLRSSLIGVRNFCIPLFLENERMKTIINSLKTSKSALTYVIEFSLT